MPTNLNALIRYKSIDACLKNPFSNCTISHLQEVCSQSMGEKRGIYRLISERTIRDDIRVLKSDILGFNAPIEFEDGKYSYTDPDYSIFSIPLTEKELLKEVMSILLEERNNIADMEVDQILVRIANTIGEAIPKELTAKPDIKTVNEKKEMAIKPHSIEESNALYSIQESRSEDNLYDETIIALENKFVKETTHNYKKRIIIRNKLIKTELDWGDVFSLLS